MAVDIIARGMAANATGEGDLVTKEYVDEQIENVNENKQDKLTAGENIDIDNNVISVGGGIYIMNESDIKVLKTLSGNYTMITPAILYLYKGDGVYLFGEDITTALYLGPRRNNNTPYYVNLVKGTIALVGNTGHICLTVGSGGWAFANSGIQFLYNNDTNVGVSSNYLGIVSYDAAITVVSRLSAIANGNYLTKDNATRFIPTGDYNPSTKLYTDKTHYENMTGYDASKTQVLKNINGTLTWVDEET